MFDITLLNFLLEIHIFTEHIHINDILYNKTCIKGLACGSGMEGITRLEGRRARNTTAWSYRCLFS